MILSIPTKFEREILKEHYNKNRHLLSTGGFDSSLPDLILAIKIDTGEMVGSISLFNITSESAEWGMSIFDGRGVPLVVPAARQFLSEAFQRIGFKKLYCKIYQANKRALTGALRAGFFITQNNDPIVLEMTYEQFERRWENGAARRSGEKTKSNKI